MDWRPYIAGALALGVLVFALVAGAAAVSTGYRAQKADFTVSNESLTVTYDHPVAVDPPETADTFYDDETVRNDSDAQLEAGADYRWNRTTGNVTFLNTTATAAGEAASISYRYAGWRAEASRLRNAATALYGVLPYFALVITGVMVVVGMAIGVLKILSSTPTR